MTPPKRNETKELSLNRAKAKCATWSAGSENRPTKVGKNKKGGTL